MRLYWNSFRNTFSVRSRHVVCVDLFWKHPNRPLVFRFWLVLINSGLIHHLYRKHAETSLLKICNHITALFHPGLLPYVAILGGSQRPPLSRRIIAYIFVIKIYSYHLEWWHPLRVPGKPKEIHPWNQDGIRWYKEDKWTRWPYCLSEDGFEVNQVTYSYVELIESSILIQSSYLENRV